VNFELHQPQTVLDALELAGRFGERGQFIAGGTDLVVQMRRGRRNPEHLIDLSGLHGLDTIEVTEDGCCLGAMATHKSIERHPDFQSDLRMLVEAAHLVGGHQVRNVATVGGNIVNASPAADVVVPLLALDAVLTLQSASGSRQVPLADFLVGPGSTLRRPGELLREVRFARLPPSSGSVFLKNGRRKAMEISVVCVAVCLTLADGVLSQVRIGLGAVAPTALRARAAEAALEGKVVDHKLIAHAASLAAQECAPLSDVRASAEYRRLLVEALVGRAVENGIERARGNHA
jgi:carbon-monoxide dehydrogenase medium subunit